jgi:hypothetical protein
MKSGLLDSGWLNLFFLFCMALQGCAGLEQAVGFTPLDVPPELKQGEVLLVVVDDPRMTQAPRSSYDIGDLQNFQSQHTLPFLAEGAFKEIFGKVDLKDSIPAIEAGQPEVPAVFEVRMLDLSSDVYMEGAETYRSQCMLAVAMKSPKGNIFWQQAFRGNGFVNIDPQWSTGLGPQDAVMDAVRDAIMQMQQAIVRSPEVLNQMRHYMASDQARTMTDA